MTEGAPHMSRRSWLSLVQEADPDFNSDENVRTREYRFTGPRVFRRRPGDWYSTAGGTST